MATASSARIDNAESQTNGIGIYEPTNPVVVAARDQSSFFEDGQRSIDFVLVWRDTDDVIENSSRALKRSKFQENLENVGLHLEDGIIDSIRFIKIHAPINILHEYAEMMNLNMPNEDVSIEL